MNYKNKKLLILGGAFQHKKIVEEAKKLGVKTYVTDYLDINNSPAKQIADVALNYNIFDYDSIVDYCKKEKIDGVIGPYLDPVQIPYFEICKRLNLPYFGDEHSYKVLTNKNDFKKFVVDSGGYIIPTYSLDDIENDNNVEYPVFMKPVDSRGSRGQFICNNKNEVLKNVNSVLEASISKDLTIEKLMSTKNDVQLMYMIIDYEPVLVRLEDRFLGSKEENLNNLCSATMVPSKLTKSFMEGPNKNIISVLKKLKLKYAPIFLQALIEDDKALLYDPGLRFSGDDFDRVYTELTGVNLSKMFIDFALTGTIEHSLLERIKKDVITVPTGLLFPCLREGKIGKIMGIDKIKKHPNVVSFSYFFKEGDIVLKTGDLKQRFCEISIKSKNIQEYKDVVNYIFDNLQVIDISGENMLICKLDTNMLDIYDNN